MKNSIVVRNYPLPQVPGIFSLPLPYATNPGDFLSLGIIQLNGQAQLLVREDEEKNRPDERTFALVESGQPIPTYELRYGCDYLGSFESGGKLLHLFGPRTRRQGGKLC